MASRIGALAWLLACCLWVSVPAGAAPEPPPAPPPLERLLAEAARLPPQQAWAYLSRYSGAYINDPYYNYALGVYASAAGDPGQAINALERAVLLAPEFAGAWLDLAVAYHRAGDDQTALELLRYIRRHFNPPAAIRAVIERFDRAWRAPPPWHAALFVGVGHSANPAAAPSAARASLFLDSQWVDFALNQDFRPHASPFFETALSVQYAGGGHLLSLRGALRRFSLQPDADQTDLSLGWRPPTDRWGYWYLSSSLFAAGYADTQRTLSVVRVFPLSARTQLGLGYRLRRYDTAALDVNSPVALYTRQEKLGRSVVSLGLSLERQLAVTADRPGGDAWRGGADIAWHRPLLRGALSLSAAVSLYQESRRYSSVLPIHRSLALQQLGLQWRRPFNARLAWQVGLRHVWQRANHSLFDWQDTLFHIGVVFQIR